MTRIIVIIAFAVLYWFLEDVTGFNYIFLTVELLCTFLHEFGHAIFALLTTGHVHSLQVNLDGSGVTTTSGGSNALITMGGYIGSAIFGNFLLRANTEIRAKGLFIAFAICMLMSVVFWFSSISSAFILLTLAILFYLATITPICAYLMNFLGVACMIYIIRDFNVGPTSDLQAYEKSVGIFSKEIWMYVWLIIVISITFFNMYSMLKKVTQ